MPDIKSEILKVKQTMQTLDNLEFDDEDGGPKQKLAMTSANLYQWIADNPGKSAADMKPCFEKATQISTRLSQGLKNGFLSAKKHGGV